MKNSFVHFFLFLGLMLLSSSLLAQNKTISGKVATASGEALPGVNVVLKGTTIGMVTDIDGKYKIEVPSGENQTLVFSYVGYETIEESMNGRTVIDIVLSESATVLNEVVAVGYATVRKKDLTGAVGTVGAKDVVKKGTISPMEALQGQVAGVEVTANSGRAGSKFKIQIRGQNSIVGGEPLYVVDGIVTDNIDFLNPQDIERVDVLKDASSTAIYGSRGTNGVVIVTTKQGGSVKGAKASISYDGYYGIRKNARMPDFMDGDKWWVYRQNAYITPNMLANKAYAVLIPGTTDQYAAIGDGRVNIGTGGAPNTIKSQLLIDKLNNKDYTDWPSLFLRDGIQNNHYLTISGRGAENLSYIIGVGYQNESGNVKKEELDKYSFKASIDHRMNDKWSGGINVNMSQTERELGSPDALIEAFRMAPLLPAYGVDPYGDAGLPILQPGKYGGIDFTSSVSPLWELSESMDNTKRLQGLGNIYLQFAPLKWITLKTTYSASFYNERVGRFQGRYTELNKGGNPSADLTKSSYFTSTWDNQLTIAKEFNGHSFNFMGLHSLYATNFENSSTYVYNMPFNSGFDNLGSAANIKSVASDFRKTTLVSFIGRLNYSYKDKYLITLSSRWDGSSKLAEGNKWRAFPSGALAWRISEESFLKGNSIVSELKLRTGYGFTGNNNISPYQTQIYANKQMYYDYYGTLANGFAPSGVSNGDLTWERTGEFNVGMDYGLLNNRITGSVEYYNKLSEDLLMGLKLPAETGFEEMIANVGSVRNKGIEVALTTVNVKTKDFRWETTFNFAKNTNEIVELFGKKVDYVANNWFIGQPINVNYTYVFDGIWQEEERDQAVSYGQLPGQAKVVDFNGDNKIDPTDRRIIGSPDPDWTGSFSTSIAYKGFDLSASLFTRQGVQVYSYFHAEFASFTDRGRAKLDVGDYYMADNTITGAMYSNKYPQPQNVGSYWSAVGYYKDASFIKVKNINLGYNFPEKIAGKLKLSSLRLYANILNPFVWTEYEGFDPEWAGARFGQDGMSYTTYQFGVNVKF